MSAEAKRTRLAAISTREGAIAAIAIDQRRSLRRMIAQAAGTEESAVPDEQLAEFKAAVTAALTQYGSAILLDPEYGLDAVRHRAPGCGLLLTYEADGFDNPRPHRMLALLPRFSARRLRDLGADAVKILLSWAPDGDPCANDEKRVWIERIGCECEALGLPFLLEPVVYDPSGPDPKSPEFLQRKPKLVVRTVEEFSKPQYNVDVLKVEFPVCSGSVGLTHTRAEALEWYRAADAVARCPYIYLSAGIPIAEFLGSLELAAEAGAHFSGILCGRAIWQDGVPIFVRGGTDRLSEWLAGEGAANVKAIVDRLRSAAPLPALQPTGPEPAHSPDRR